MDKHGHELAQLRPCSAFHLRVHYRTLSLLSILLDDNNYDLYFIWYC